MRHLREEVAVLLQLVANATSAFHDGGEVDVSFTLHGQQLALRLLIHLVILDGDGYLWSNNALQKNPHRILLGVSFDSWIIEHRRQKALVYEGVTNLLNVVTQSIAREWNVVLERERLTNGSIVESRDLDVETLNFGLFTGRDFVGDISSQTARARLLDRFDGRIEVTPIAQVDLNLISVTSDDLLRKPVSRLHKIHARAQLIGRDW